MVYISEHSVLLGELVSRQDELLDEAHSAQGLIFRQCSVSINHYSNVHFAKEAQNRLNWLQATQPWAGWFPRMGAGGHHLRYRGGGGRHRELRKPMPADLLSLS